MGWAARTKHTGPGMRGISYAKRQRLRAEWLRDIWDVEQIADCLNAAFHLGSIRRTSSMGRLSRAFSIRMRGR